jgi:hypothetical protein
VKRERVRVPLKTDLRILLSLRPRASQRHSNLARILVYQGSDPNGIRTRVTAVKGRCPGPLDDRVKKPGNIGIAMPRRKANRRGDFQKRESLNASVGARGSTSQRARSRLRVRLTQHVRFPRDVGAIRYRGEVRQRHARASRYR